jgi:hypothetical protein
MKILKIILVAIFVLFVIPLNVFCENGHSDDVTHHCVLVCHHSCCQTITLNNNSQLNLPSQTTFLVILESSNHENPFLSTSKRPPIDLS